LGGRSRSKVRKVIRQWSRLSHLCRRQAPPEGRGGTLPQLRAGGPPRPPASLPTMWAVAPLA